MANASTLSRAAVALQARIEGAPGIGSVEVQVGHPGSFSAPTVDQVNIFFYRFEHAGPPQVPSENPFALRVHCVITALGVASGQEYTAGEQDLRLLGLVISELHRTPSLDVPGADGALLARLEIVPAPLTLDDINKIWSTQQGASYRPSVAYELALLPVWEPEPRTSHPHPKTTVVGVVGDMSYQAPPRAVTGRTVVDLTEQAWTPRLVLMGGGNAVETLSVDRAENDAGVSLALAAIGKPGETLRLRYAYWGERISWTVSTAPGVLKIAASEFDPDAPSAPDVVDFPLPHRGHQQLLVWAERALGARVLTSNTLLVVVRETGG